MNNLRIFGMAATSKFATQVADYLDVPLNKHVEKYFPNREPYVRADENVRGCDVYIIQSIYSDENESVNDKLVKLLFFIGALRDASAERITAVIPYFDYLRQDRKTEPRAPITTKYIAILLEKMQVDRVLSLDVHNLSAFQSAFRIPTDHLEAKNLMVNHIVDKFSKEDIVVLSPDSGGVGRADRFRKSLSAKLNKVVDLVHMDKIREGSIVHGTRISDDIKGKKVLVVDDMISSGSTLAKCAETVEKSGGELLAACASHGLFVGNDLVNNLAKLRRLIITDTLDPDRLSDKIKENLTVLPTAKLFARAIRRTHDDSGSISDLLR